MDCAEDRLTYWAEQPPRTLRRLLAGCEACGVQNGHEPWCPIDTDDREHDANRIDNS